jgi:peptide/nickel transport system substrate-binding protein
MGLLLLFAGCTNDAALDDTSACGRTGNELIIRQRAEPDLLNPMLTSSGYADQINQLIFLPLETIHPSTLEMTPVLVEKRPEIKPTAEGGMRYTFDILEEAVWDDGSPVTAHDYLFTVKLGLHPGINVARFGPFLGIIAAVEIDPDDPKHFSVITKQQDQLGEEIVTNTVYVMPAYHYDPKGILAKIPQEAFFQENKLGPYTEQLETFAQQFSEPQFSREPTGITGCGAYRLDSWTTGQLLTLSKKENWWGEGLAEDYPMLAAYPDIISFQPIAEGATAMSVIQGEDIDLVPELTPDAFVQLSEDSLVQECYTLESFPQLVRSMLSLNTRSPKLNDKRVRRALALSMDADQIISTVYNGFGDRLSTPVPPSIAFANNDLKPLPYDPEQAKTLLAEAGWADSNQDGTVDRMINGEKVELIFKFEVPVEAQSSQQLALLIKEQMKASGIGIDILPGEWNEIQRRYRSGDFEIIPVGRTFPSPTVWNPRQNYHSQGQNFTGFGNAETDALIDRILVTFDEEERFKLYRDLQAIIYDEQPEIYIFTPRARIAIHKRFETPLTPISPGFVPSLIKLKK